MKKQCGIDRGTAAVIGKSSYSGSRPRCSRRSCRSATSKVNWNFMGRPFRHQQNTTGQGGSHGTGCCARVRSRCAPSNGAGRLSLSSDFSPRETWYSESSRKTYGVLRKLAVRHEMDRLPPAASKYLIRFRETPVLEGKPTTCRPWVNRHRVQIAFDSDRTLHFTVGRYSWSTQWTPSGNRCSIFSK